MKKDRYETILVLAIFIIMTAGFFINISELEFCRDGLCLKFEKWDILKSSLYLGLVSTGLVLFRTKRNIFHMIFHKKPILGAVILLAIYLAYKYIM